MVVTVTGSRPASRSGPGPGPEHRVIVAEELEKTYPGGVHAMRGISFSAATGGSFGLLGPNGAGKSITIGMLNTTIRPTSGRALLAGFDVQADPMSTRRVSSVVFQDPVVDRPLTGRQNLQLHLRLRRMPKADGLARLAELTAAVGLAGMLDRPVATYSGRAAVQARDCPGPAVGSKGSVPRRAGSRPGHPGPPRPVRHDYRAAGAHRRYGPIDHSILG